MNKVFFISLFIANIAFGMDSSGSFNDIDDQLCAEGIDQRDGEGRIISIDDLFSDYVKVPHQFQCNVTRWKNELKKIKVQEYNNKVASAIKRNNDPLERMVTILQAIQESMDDAGKEQEQQFAAQIKQQKSSSAFSRRSWAAGFVLASLGFGTSLLFNILQVTGTV